MNTLPRRRQRPRMGVREPSQIRCPGHLKFIRSLECAVHGACRGGIEAAHVRRGTDGGTGVKPSDCYTIPLCAYHHARQHAIGEQQFEKEYRINMRKIADGLWRISDARKRWEASREN